MSKECISCAKDVSEKIHFKTFIYYLCMDCATVNETLNISCKKFGAFASSKDVKMFTPKGKEITNQFQKIIKTERSRAQHAASERIAFLVINQLKHDGDQIDESEDEISEVSVETELILLSARIDNALDQGNKELFNSLVAEYNSLKKKVGVIYETKHVD